MKRTKIKNDVIQACDTSLWHKPVIRNSNLVIWSSEEVFSERPMMGAYPWFIFLKIAGAATTHLNETNVFGRHAPGQEKPPQGYATESHHAGLGAVVRRPRVHRLRGG